VYSENLNDMKITLIAGARPNFMKIAALIHAIQRFNNKPTSDSSLKGREGSSPVKGGECRIEYRLVHTGQHYDKNMSDTFFEELGIPAPDVNLGCGGGSQAEQTAAIMVAFEKELMAHPTDVVLVVGDVTSTMACSIVAKKLNTRVCHVEAGIRSWDLTMPEEINRMVTDSLADYMFTTSDVANANLVRMGATLMNDIYSKTKTRHQQSLNCDLHSLTQQPVCEQALIQSIDQSCAAEVLQDASQKHASLTKNIKNSHADERVKQQVWFVGNVMIDTLLANRNRFRKPEVWEQLGLHEKEYIVMTMHRPANVDEENHLRAMMEQIVDNAHGLPIIFPIHPRTALRLKELMSEGMKDASLQDGSANLQERFPNLHIVEPMGYLEFNYLVERAKAVVTDSGGITEETTVMGVPCITLRDNTERPETCTVGTNELIGTNPAAIKPALDKLFAGEWKKGAIPELWDGRAAERIVEILAGL
jgi:UDP-N-acetylglucosamine 2-epimerase (non-hydrolysing)